MNVDASCSKSGAMSRPIKVDICGLPPLFELEESKLSTISLIVAMFGFDYLNENEGRMPYFQASSIVELFLIVEPAPLLRVILLHYQLIGANSGHVEDSTKPTTEIPQILMGQ